MKATIQKSRLLRGRRLVLPQASVILYYHSVSDRAAGRDAHISPAIAIDERHFREHMELLARRYNPVTINDIVDWIEEKVTLPPNSVAVTFDDGFADNYGLAAPIMEQYGLRGTFYLTASCIEKQTLPWFCKIWYLIKQAMRARVKLAPTRLHHGYDFSREGSGFDAWSVWGDACAKLCDDRQAEWIRGIEHELNISYDATNAPTMMTWSHAAELIQRGHVIGNHTYSHPNVAYLSWEDQSAEIVRAHALITERLACPINHFSYPHPCLNPQWDTTSQSIIKATGYRTIVLTEQGAVTRSSSLLGLRRISVGNITPAELEWKLETALSGILR